MTEELQLDPMTWLRQQRRRIVDILLGVVVVLGPLGLILSLLGLVQGTGLTFTFPVYLAAYLVAVVLLVVRRIPIEWRALGFFALLYGFALFAFVAGWLAGGGRLFLLVMIIVSAVLLGMRASLVAAGLSLVTYVAFALAYTLGLLVSRYEFPMNTVVIEGVGFALTIGLTVMGTWAFDQALQAAARATGEMRKARGMLDERTEELEVTNRLLVQRAEAMRVTSGIASDVTSVLDQQTLLDRVVTSIGTQLGYHHAGIFLLDTTGKWVELQTASSEAGHRMLAQGYRLRVEEAGIVGRVITRGILRIIMDVGKDVVPDTLNLADTRSRVTLPLRARGEIIGALDVQSAEPQAFSRDDVAILQTLADQVAVAISNARLFQQVEESLLAERRAYGELSRQAWQDLLRRHPDMGYLSDHQGTVPAGNLWEPQMERAVQTGQAVSGTDGEMPASITIPIKARDRVIGVIDARKPGGAGAWTAEELALLETLTDQLGASLESARLFRDSQQRAIREQLLSEVTARMRETLDIETVLKTTAQEVRQALGLPEVTIRLTDRPTGGPSDAAKHGS